METQKDFNQRAANDYFLRKVNTWLLTICTAAVIWGAKEINSLDSRMASMEAVVNASRDNISKLEMSRGSHELRINAVEISQADLRSRMLNLENIFNQKTRQ